MNINKHLIKLEIQLRSTIHSVLVMIGGQHNKKKKTLTNKSTGGFCLNLADFIDRFGLLRKKYLHFTRNYEAIHSFGD